MLECKTEAGTAEAQIRVQAEVGDEVGGKVDDEVEVPLLDQ
jgi:hypothetical protein